MLANKIEAKIIPKSYGRIQHLTGSKMIDAADKLIGQQEETYLTVKTHSKDDVVIVTEKVDGCNVGVLRKGNELFPILRAGYDVRTNQFEWIRAFADFVEANHSRFMWLLSNDERVCGEWMIKTHTLRYKMSHEPFIVFDIINGKKRCPYDTMVNRAKEMGFVTAGLVHKGAAIPVNTALDLIGNGFHGAQNGIEGIVYRYENKNGFWFSAKYVSNPLVGNAEIFHANIDNQELYNEYK